MDPWIHRSAAGAAKVAAAATYLLRNYKWERFAAPCMYVTKYTAKAEAAAPAVAPGADTWIHGCIFFTMKHIFYNEMKSTTAMWRQCLFFRSYKDHRYSSQPPDLPGLRLRVPSWGT